MATPVNVGEIVQVTPQYLIEGQQCENVWYFECVNADSDMLANLLLVIATCIIEHLLPALGNNVTLERIVGKVVGPTLRVQDEWVPAGGDIVVGGASGDVEPSFVSAVVSLYSTRGGRSGRGRFYVGGIPEADTTQSLLNTETGIYPAILATLACIAAAFPLNELGTAAKYQWVILSRKLAGTNKPPFPISSVARVTRYRLNRELGTTRSRKLGRGK